MTKTEHWFSLVAEQEQSSFSITAFCTFRDIKLNTFHYWRKKYKQSAGDEFNMRLKELNIRLRESKQRTGKRQMLLRNRSRISSSAIIYVVQFTIAYSGERHFIENIKGLTLFTEGEQSIFVNR